MKSFPEIPVPELTPLSSLYQLPITMILVRPLCLIPAVIVLILSEYPVTIFFSFFPNPFQVK